MAVIVAVAGSVASAQVIDFEGITLDILNVSDENPLETQGFLFTPENPAAAVFGPVPTGTTTFAELNWTGPSSVVFSASDDLAIDNLVIPSPGVITTVGLAGLVAARRRR